MKKTLGLFLALVMLFGGAVIAKAEEDPLGGTTTTGTTTTGRTLRPTTAAQSRR